MAGELTDRLNQPFIHNGLSSKYHIYAAGLDWNEPVGVLFYTDGSGDWGLNNPSNTYLLAGANGLVAVAKKHNLMLVTLFAPGNGCTDGDGVCWYLPSFDGTTIAQKIAWSRACIDAIFAEYPALDRSRVVIAGYSSGAQWTTQYFGPEHASDIMDDGLAVAISYGGEPLVTPQHTQSHKDNVPYVWNVGANDPAWQGDGIYDAQSGYDWYSSNGFATTELQVVPGTGHDRTAQFGTVMDNAIAAYLDYDPPTLERVVPGIVGTASAGVTTGGAGLTVTLPAGATSYLAFVMWDGSETDVNPPSGWTLVASRERGGYTHLDVYLANASDSPGNTWTSTSSAHRAVAVVGFDVLVTIGVNSLVNGAAAPSITIPETALVARVAGDLNDSSSALGYPTAATLGRVQRVQYGGGWAASVAVAFEQKAAGSTGTGTFSIPASWSPVAGSLEVIGWQEVEEEERDSTGLAVVQGTATASTTTQKDSTGLAVLHSSSTAISTTERETTELAPAAAAAESSVASSRTGSADAPATASAVGTTTASLESSGTALAELFATSVAGKLALLSSVALLDVEAEADTSTERATEGVAAALADADAETADVPDLDSTGTAELHALASAELSSERSTVATADQELAALASTATERATVATADQELAALASATTERATEGVASAAASALHSSDRVAGTENTAELQALALGASTGVRGTTGQAITEVVADSTTATLRKTTGTAELQASASYTLEGAQATSGDAEAVATASSVAEATHNTENAAAATASGAPLTTTERTTEGVAAATASANHTLAGLQETAGTAEAVAAASATVAPRHVASGVASAEATADADQASSRRASSVALGRVGAEGVWGSTREVVKTAEAVVSAAYEALSLRGSELVAPMVATAFTTPYLGELFRLRVLMTPVIELAHLYPDGLEVVGLPHSVLARLLPPGSLSPRLGVEPLVVGGPRAAVNELEVT